MKFWKGKREQLGKPLKVWYGNLLAAKKNEKELLQKFPDLGCNLSLKTHFSYILLDFFPKNCGTEMFHQDIATMERRYQGPWDESMLADYCWTPIRDTRDSTYKKQSKRKCSR
ncbi:uncharacterized protein TNCV_846501 [Trichonephila clavipes]|nr:uncharacterized protein TNCV_846501 [Trichonephila clavipes]